MTNEVLDQPALSPAILQALSIGNLPDMEWNNQDDLCNCIYQRVGMWKNPYLAETLEVRLCCVWGKLAEQYPDAVRTIPGYFNENSQEWMTQPIAWDGESEMPKAIWYRHLARKFDRPLSEIRAEYADKDELRPKGTPRPERREIPFLLMQGGQEFWVNFG